MGEAALSMDFEQLVPIERDSSRLAETYRQFAILVDSLKDISFELNISDKGFIVVDVGDDVELSENMRGSMLYFEQFVNTNFTTAEQQEKVLSLLSQKHKVEEERGS